MIMEAHSKWKVGDLVTLSAAGKNVKQNEGLWLGPKHRRRVIGYGIVMGFHSCYATWPVQVKWFGRSNIKSCNFKDYELKKFK